VATKKQKIRLVVFKGEGFPLDQESFDLLKNVGLTVFRLPIRLLSTLESSLLRRYELERVPFRLVYEHTLSFFERERLSTIPSYRFKVESNMINLSAPYSSLEELEQCVTELQYVLSRYGVKAARSNEKVINDEEGKPSRKALRLECKADPDINPGAFWKSPVLPVQSATRFNLSRCASLVFSSRPSSVHPGRNSFGVAFEDYLGGEWVQAFKREFLLGTISEDDIVQAINFFANLLDARKNYTPPVTPETHHQ
jgi:hypothetical protein